MLEIGPGWGAFAGHALQAGARFTGITNSEVSQTYLRGKLANFGDNFDIELTDFYEYQPKEKFDAIVIMGVIEHLPDYERVLKKFSSLLKPGGRVFLDGSAWKKKYELSTFMVRHIYPGNHSFLVLDDFLNKMGKTDFEVDVIHNDRWSYYLTFKQWAINLDAHKDYIQRTFGDFEFRKFRLYLWGATYEFLHRNLDCYRLILSKPKVITTSQKGSPMCELCNHSQASRLSRRAAMLGMGAAIYVRDISAQRVSAPTKPISLTPPPNAIHPDEALKRLMEGNARYAANEPNEKDFSAGRAERVARAISNRRRARLLGQPRRSRTRLRSGPRRYFCRAHRRQFRRSTMGSPASNMG